MDITLCNSNINLNSLVLGLKNSFPSHNILFSECLHCCGECSRYPIAKVDGRVLVGEDIIDLVDKIQLIIGRR
jgi:uncharacterized protein YuzB (UPF0349 family)